MDYFVYRAAKEIGALAAVLGGIDGLVFTAGIGENSAEIRARICEASAWLGIDLDADANAPRRTADLPSRKPRVGVGDSDERRTDDRPAHRRCCWDSLTTDLIASCSEPGRTRVDHDTVAASPSSPRSGSGVGYDQSAAVESGDSRTGSAHTRRGGCGRIPSPASRCLPISCPRDWHASLAGLPPEAGVYACLFSGLVFWFFCSSKHTVVTVTSGLSLLVAASVGGLSGGDPVRHAALAACLTLMIASVAVVAWLVRAGSAVGFFSETVLVGFKAGLAFYLASTQLPKLFGSKGTSGDFWERSAYFLGHLSDTHWPSLILGVAALAVLIAGKLWMKHRPVAFLVVVGGIVAARLLQLDAQGVALLGEVPRGLPSIGLPMVSRSELNDLVPVALAGFLLAAVETSAIGRMFSQKHGNRFDANREMLAIGAANLVAGLGRGFPVSGGMSQSLVNESAGARTPISGLIAAICMLIVALFASGLLRNLPQPVWRPSYSPP